MTVRLRFQSTGLVPGDGYPIVMHGPSLTIGRGPENDVVLPDPDRMVSKTHCVIEDHNGSVVVVDLSTNGTFLNYGKVPLGNRPTPVNHGDVLTLGPYELVVDILADGKGGRIAEPLAEGPISHGRADRAPNPLDLLDSPGPGGGNFLDDLLGPANPPTGPRQFKTEEDPFDQLISGGADDDPLFGSKATTFDGPAMRDNGPSVSDAFRPAAPQKGGIPDDWDDLLDLGKPAASPAQPAPRAPQPPQAPPSRPPAQAPFHEEDPFRSVPPRTAAVAPPATPLQLTPAQSAPPAAAPPLATGGTDLARVFLQALGAGEVKIADEDMAGAMTRLGGVLKAMITGLREILMTRTSIKSEFRIDQTMIGAGGNNPLKFSVSPEQAIEAMAKPSAKGYLSAEVATEQALKDIKAHEVAMVTGMEAALKGVLKKLDPKTLEARIAEKGGVGFLQNRKAKYWETYEQMYAEISDQAENQFHDLFAREFAAAYKAQLDRLK